MSSVVFPTLAGLTWDRVKVPQFSTEIQRSVSGRESRLAYMLYPTWMFKLQFDILRAASAYQELQKIMGLFLEMRGAHDSFLFTDPDDSSVTDQQFGTRDGSTTEFQLLRTFGAGGYDFSEPIENVNVLTNIKSNGNALTNPTDYTISNTGLVTLAAAGTAGHVLTWTGTYYFRCRFREDMAEFNQFMKNLWNYRKCELVGALGNKI